MKYLLTLLLALGMTTSVQALDNCVTGSWYDPENSGSGINVEVMDDVVVVYYYTPGRWLSFLGANDLPYSVDLNLYQTTSEGTRYAGDGSIDIIDNDTMVFNYMQQYDFWREDATIPWCIGCTGTFEYVRLTQPIPCEN